MKIRHGFVSNSSSSSFIILAKPILYNDMIQLTEYPDKEIFAISKNPMYDICYDGFIVDRDMFGFIKKMDNILKKNSYKKAILNINNDNSYIRDICRIILSKKSIISFIPQLLNFYILFSSTINLEFDVFDMNKLKLPNGYHKIKLNLEIMNNTNSIFQLIDRYVEINNSFYNYSEEIDI